MSKVKVSFNLSDQDVQTLRNLASKRGSTVTDVLRRAIATEDFIQGAVERGERILIADKDKQAPMRELLVR